jgi:Ca-activated chloride channel family protein
MMNLSFGEPLGLIALAVALPLLAFWAWWSDHRSRHLLGKFAAGSMVERLSASFSRPRQRSKAVLSILACLCLLLAIARPQWGTEIEEIELRGVDVLFALDTSRSMLAEDYSPNRLERSKLAITDLVNRLRGDRVGLIAFAGDAFLQCPLTLDYGAFLQTLRSMNTDTIPRGGTDIAAAIDEAMAYFENTDYHRVLILISDGEDLEARGIRKAREAAERNITIFTVGIGTPGGELIPLRQPDGSVDYVRDHTGNPVRTRLDEHTLTLIAEAGGGIYKRFTPGADALDEIYNEARSLIGEDNIGSLTREIPIERFYWPLALGLLFIILEWSLSNRRRRPATSNLTKILIACLLLQFLPVGPDASLQGSPRQAERHYSAGEYQQAIELWQVALKTKPEDARLHYNLGNALYRDRQFAAAVQAYQSALPLADVDLQERIFFNLGNAQYQLGVEKMVEAPNETTELWDRSLESYDNSLAINPQASDAHQNRNWVETQFTYHGARIQVLPGPAEGGSTSSGGLFLPGMVLELEAEPNENWRFVQWQGAEVEDPESQQTAMVVQQSGQVVAVFHPTRYLEVLSEDESAGTAKTSGRYDLDQEVPIQAESKDYFVFHLWESDTLEFADASAAETTVKLTGDGRVMARFVDAYHLEVISQPAIAGNVGTTGFYERNTEPGIHAEARDGFEWIGWIGDNIDDTTAPQTTVNLIRDSKTVAHFQRIWNLVVLPDSDQHGTTTGGGNFPLGNIQPIEAVANEGYTFLGWDGPGVADPEAPQTTVEVLSDEQTIIAIFEEDESEDENEQDSDSEGDGEGNGESDPDANDEQDESPADPEDQQDPQTDQPQPEEEQPAQEEEAAPARETPESLTEEEARQLLQMLRQDERQLPLRIDQDRDEPPTTGRDW